MGDKLLHDRSRTTMGDKLLHDRSTLLWGTSHSMTGLELLYYGGQVTP